MHDDHIPRCVRCVIRRKHKEGHYAIRYGSVTEDDLRNAPLCKIRELVVKPKVARQSPFKKSTGRRVRRTA